MKKILISWIINTLMDAIIRALREKAKDTAYEWDDSFVDCFERNKDAIAHLGVDKI